MVQRYRVVPSMGGDSGLTLLELLLVVAILGIVATVAVPSLSPLGNERLEVAASETADALRFARSEAMRTGVPHGVLIDNLGTEPVGGEVTVYQVDSVAFPFAIGAILRHPLDKRLYALQITDGPQTPGIAIANTTAPFLFDAVAGAQMHVHFDAGGAPVLSWNGARHRLTAGAITLSDGVATRTVTVQPLTGRVVVQ